jgi:sugar phosphate isomerase/epimerase
MEDNYYSQLKKHGTSNDVGLHSREMKEIDRSHEVGIDEIGTTTNPFEHQTQALKARIFHGASRVEFTFFGQGKGRKEQPTPETFGKRERLDMRELAEFNNVETTTHATVGVNGLSGLNMQQGTFSDDQRKQAIDEIKRAIHFAAEATTGGAVVFHTGEAPRYLHGRKFNGDKDTEFEMYPEEADRKVTYLADPLSKRLIAQISEIDKIAAPKYQRDKNGFIEYLKDENGNDVVDVQIKDVDRLHGGRVPLYKHADNGDIQTELIDFRKFKKGRIEDLKRLGKLPSEDKLEEHLAKDFAHQQKFVDVMYSLNFGINNENMYKDELKSRDKLIKALNFYKELKKTVPKKDWWKFEKQTTVARSDYEAAQLGFTPPENVDPVEWLQDKLQENARSISYFKEVALHGRRTATQELDTIKRSKLADTYAVEQSSKSMGELGLYLYQVNEKAKKDHKSGKTPFGLKNDLYLAPENLFPEMYGSHPEELKTLIEGGRTQMAKNLVNHYGMTEKQAAEKAKHHIKATLDIGHLNVWKKYFKAKPKESLESRDKRFNEWVLKKTQKLFDEGIIGHVHISDNFGFHDEHLTAGDGTAPIKEFVKQAKKQGFKEFVVESGSFNPMTSLPDSWMHFDSPVYGLHVPGFTKDTWTDPSARPGGFNQFYRQYFGRTEGPRYLVGDTAPSEDFRGAPFYTGIGLE